MKKYSTPDQENASNSAKEWGVILVIAVILAIFTYIWYKSGTSPLS